MLIAVIRSLCVLPTMRLRTPHWHFPLACLLLLRSALHRLQLLLKRAVAPCICQLVKVALYSKFTGHTHSTTEGKSEQHADYPSGALLNCCSICY